MEKDHSVIATALYKTYNAIVNVKDWGFTVTAKEDSINSVKRFITENCQDVELEGEKLEESLGNRYVRLSLRNVVKKVVNPTNTTGGNTLVYLVVVLVVVLVVLKFM